MLLYHGYLWRFLTMAIFTADLTTVPPLLHRCSTPVAALEGRRVKILVPSGALLVWDSRLPHENFPNEGHDWRMAPWRWKVVA